MTTYTADDFKNARFATNRDGRIAVRFYHGLVAADYPWAVIGRRSTVANPCVRDSHMTNAGWVPVQENPRPLIADDITDEMVERAQAAISEKSNGDFTPGEARTYNILRAALTPPPSRPEGAEEVQALIRQAEVEGEGADNEALANYLAARLTGPTVKEQS